MKMQKSTMILTGVLGVISVGSVLMFANPGMQEALVSNIFRSRMYSVPAKKPVAPATINKNPWGVTPSKPSISGEVIIRPTTPTTSTMGRFEMYMNDRLAMVTASITKDGASSSCMQNSGLNPKSSVRCTWNGSEIFSRKIVTSPTPSISGEVVIRPNTPPKPSISGEVILRPTTPTKPVDVLASITITVDGKNQPDIYNTYKLNEKEAVSYCANLASKVLTTSKFSCIWNGKELGKGFGTKVVVVTKPTVPVTPLATLIMNSDYWGMQTQANMSEGSAKEVCESTWKKYETNSRYTSLVCTWNGRTVFSKTKFSSTNTGTVVVPKTPVSTGSTSSGVTNTGTLGLGKMDILVNNQARNPEYNISRSEALTKCIGYLPSIPVSSIVLCKWNGTTIYTGNGYILSNTGSWYYPTTGTGTLPKTPVSTGSTASGVITPAKPVDVLASITVTVDGKNQPDIYNTYKLNEMEAMNYCANLASKVLTTSKFSCIWNGKELGKGFGTKVVTTTSTGSWYYPTTGTGTLPKTPVSTGSTSNTVITVNSGTTIPLGKLEIFINNEIWSTNNNIDQSYAGRLCTSYLSPYVLSSIPNSSAVVCKWNGVVIYSGKGTKVVTPTNTGSTSTGVTNSGATTSLGKMDMWVNNQAWNPEYNISQSGALTKCTNYLPSIPTSSVVLCKWNGTTIYSGGGKQVVIQTNSGSTSSGSTRTGSLK